MNLKNKSLIRFAMAAIGGIPASSLLASLLISSGQAQGTTYRQNLAEASFSASNGCVSAHVVIDGAVVVTGRGRMGGADFAGDVIISKADSCLNVSESGSGETDMIAFSGDLQSATLVGEIPLNGSMGSTGSVHVDLTWIGFGKVTQDTMDTGPGTAALLRETVWSRKAILTGTVDGLRVTSTESATLIQRRALVEGPPRPSNVSGLEL